MNRSESPRRTDGGTAIGEGAGAPPIECHSAETSAHTTSELARTRGTARWLAVGLVVLAVSLAVNAVRGPLVMDIVTYPFSETMVHQTIGLEAVTLAVVVPWALVVAVLCWQGHHAGPIAASPPSPYAVYMFALYVLGPEYLRYRAIIA